MADQGPLSGAISAIGVDSRVEPLTEEEYALLGQLDLTLCDFVGDSGCCDPTCWQCHSAMGPENLRCLAKNLATAAMCCRAWQQRDTDPAWRPGCQLEAVPRG